MKSIFLLLTIFVLSGCSTVSTTVPLVQNIPDQWGTNARKSLQQKNGIDLTRWWEQFGDTNLTKLIQTVIESNHDLKLAKARVIEVRELRNSRQGFLAPNIDATASYSRIRQSQNAATFSPNSKSNYNSYGTGLEASWELDLYGGVKAGVDVADAELRATEYDAAAIQIAIIAETARNYVDLRMFQQQLVAAKEISSCSHETMTIVSTKQANGLVSLMDVSQAEAQQAATHSEISRLEGAIEQVKNRLAVLAGQHPGTLAKMLGNGKVPVVPETVTISSPAELLSRRPDIKVAEQEIMAAAGKVKIVSTDLYPKVSLIGSIGTQSISLANLFTSGSSLWNVGPTIRFPLFNFGRLQALVKAEESRYQQSVVRFEKLILNALEDVENGIAAYLSSEEQRRSLASAVSAARNAQEQAKDLYASGLVDYMPVLDSQRTQADLSSKLYLSEGSTANSLIRLFTALGGGWDVY